MHPVLNTGFSATIATPVVGIIVWFASLAHLTIPSDVVGYLVVLVTVGLSYTIHTNTQEVLNA